MFREIGAALAVFVLIAVGAVMVLREQRAERKRQERLERGFDEEEARQRRNPREQRNGWIREQ